jgi:hypothetical protein
MLYVQNKQIFIVVFLRRGGGEERGDCVLCSIYLGDKLEWIVGDIFEICANIKDQEVERSTNGLPASYDRVYLSNIPYVKGIWGGEGGIITI